MKITKSAIKYIKDELNDEINGIIIQIGKSCCSIGEDIRIAFGHIDGEYMLVDGIRVKSNDMEYLKDLVIDYKNNMIVFEG